MGGFTNYKNRKASSKEREQGREGEGREVDHGWEGKRGERERERGGGEGRERTEGGRERDRQTEREREECQVLCVSFYKLRNGRESSKESKGGKPGDKGRQTDGRGRARSGRGGREGEREREREREREYQPKILTDCLNRLAQGFQ